MEALIPALNKVGRYDRELFATFADIIKARFTEFETPGLAASLPVYAAHDYFDAALWDDVADAITYANHYLAPSRTPLTDLAALYSAYAKYEVDRGDLFVCLARGIHEDRLKGLPAEELRAVVGGFLGAWKALNFYPDATEALLVAARLDPGAMGPAENALISDVEAAVSGVVAVLQTCEGICMHVCLYETHTHTQRGVFGEYKGVGSEECTMTGQWQWWSECTQCCIASNVLRRVHCCCHMCVRARSCAQMPPVASWLGWTVATRILSTFTAAHLAGVAT